MYTSMQTDEKNSSQIRKKYDITATFTDVKKNT